ncbi:M1 family metallopeptidase [bacterium]|nr:M1 family metallopeptidase [bacterium]
MKRVLIFAGLFISFTGLSGQVIFQEPLSPRNANYNMDIRLDTEKKQIHGSEILTWRNITHNATSELQFHLYMNAFKNNQSTHIKEGGGRARKLDKEKAWGWIDIHRLVVSGIDLTDQIQFIQPDDDNEADQSVISVPLPRAVKPGQEIRIAIDFITQLPIVYRRNGFYEDNFFFAAQWFPKVGVLEDKGWNCHQFHNNTEFFSDYGVYNVQLTVPENYVVGSTGIVQRIEHGDSLKILHIHAEDVHDFAWTAWPHYLIAKENYKGVDIIHLYEKDHSGTVELTVQAMKNTMDYLGEWVGEYPYPAITVVHPPTGCFDVAGMEYPMFITGGAFFGIPEDKIKLTTMVTVHEFGHNWFYGIIGNNEFEEAWLDEGLNSYAECRIMNNFYGKNTSMLNFFGLTMGELGYQRLSYLQLRRWDRTLRPAWTYLGGGYGTHSYSKPALMLWTLENYVGRPYMDKIMRTFFQRWKFKHPHSQDFIDVVNEITGENYDWFFDQLLKGSNELDYRVTIAFTRKVREKKGLFDEDGGKTLYPVKDEDGVERESDEENEEAQMYRSIVRVHRKGEVVIPVEVLLVFENGDSLQYNWDGQERWMRYDVFKDSRLDYAVVDPERKLVIDSEFTNNSLTVEPRKKPVTLLSNRALYWIESVLHIFGFAG